MLSYNPKDILYSSILLLYVEYKIDTITEIGTASKIHKKPNSVHHKTIQININNGLAHKVCDITIGTKILFSDCWIARYKIKIATNPLNPYNDTPISNAGNIPRNGHKYGINSTIQAINANVNLLGISTPIKSKPINDNHK